MNFRQLIIFLGLLILSSAHAESDLDSPIICEGEHTNVEKQNINALETRKILEELVAKECLSKNETYEICKCSKDLEYRNTLENEDKLLNLMRKDWVLKKSLPELIEAKSQLIPTLDALATISLPLPKECKALSNISKENPCDQDDIALLKKSKNYQNQDLSLHLQTFIWDSAQKGHKLDLEQEASKLALELISFSLSDALKNEDEKSFKVENLLSKFSNEPGLFSVSSFQKLLEDYSKDENELSEELQEQIFFQAQLFSLGIANFIDLESLKSLDDNKDIQKELKSSISEFLDNYKDDEYKKLSSQCLHVSSLYSNLCPNDGIFSFNYSLKSSEFLEYTKSYESPLVVHNYVCSQAQNTPRGLHELTEDLVNNFISSNSLINLDPSQMQIELAPLGYDIGLGLLDLELGYGMGGRDKMDLGFDMSGSEPLNIGAYTSKSPPTNRYEATPIISKLAKNKWIAKGISFGKKFANNSNNKDKAISDFFKKARKDKKVVAETKKPNDDSSSTDIDSEDDKNDEDDDDKEEKKNESIARSFFNSPSFSSPSFSGMPSGFASLRETEESKRDDIRKKDTNKEKKKQKKKNKQEPIANNDLSTDQENTQNAPYYPSLPKKIEDKLIPPSAPVVIPKVARAKNDRITYSSPEYNREIKGIGKNRGIENRIPAAKISKKSKEVSSPNNETTSNNAAVNVNTRLDNDVDTGNISSGISSANNVAPPPKLNPAQKAALEERMRRRAEFDGDEDQEEEFIDAEEFDLMGQASLRKLYKKQDGSPVKVKRKRSNGFWYFEIYVLTEEMGLIETELKNFYRIK